MYYVYSSNLKQMISLYQVYSTLYSTSVSLESVQRFKFFLGNLFRMFSACFLTLFVDNILFVFYINEMYIYICMCMCYLVSNAYKIRGYDRI